MKTTSVVLALVSLSAVSAYAGAGCAGCAAGAKPTAAAATTTAETTSERHPLKGVVIEVMADQTALLVKHEEIPGVMRAMTMLLKVDAAALTSVKKGDAVTGQLVRKADGWWLEETKAANAVSQS